MEVPFKIITASGEIKAFTLEDEMALSVQAGEQLVIDANFSSVQLSIVNEVDLKLLFEDGNQLLIMNATKHLLDEQIPFSLQFVSAAGTKEIATYEQLLSALEDAQVEPVIQSSLEYDNESVIEEAVQEETPSDEPTHHRSASEVNLEQFIDDNSSFINRFVQTDEPDESNEEPNSIVGSGGADDIEGTTGDDVIDSGKGNDTIDAGSGDDIIDAGKGKDTILAGDGDDTIVFDSKDSIDGGEGFDTLLVEDIRKLDISKLKNDITNIEEIDMQDGMENELKNVSIEDVLDMTDENKTLYITGDEGDSLSFKNAQEWIQTNEQIELDDTVYDVWTNDDFTLNIDVDILVVDI